MAILIRNGEIVTPLDRTVADVYVDGGTIQAIGRDLSALAGRDCAVIDASGQYVLPGGVDVHTHLDMPFMGTCSADDFETGTVAAVCGGTTSHIDFVIPGQGEPLLEALETWHGKARGKAVIDYAFHMAVTHYSEAVAREIPKVVEAGITSFKTFMAYKGALMLEDEGLFDLMVQTRDLGALVTVHAENADIIGSMVKRFKAEGKLAPRYHALSRPPQAEAEATHRAIALANLADRPLYVVHVTCAQSLAEIKAMAADGHPIMAETCPQYLLLDDNAYDWPDFGGSKVVMSPPLRTPADQEALWKGLAQGYVQTVATDHCPFNMAQKRMGEHDFTKIPNGAPGIEHRLNLLHTYGVLEGRFSLERFVEVTATAPAKIFGLYPRKGAVAVGSDADLVIYDPAAKGTISASTHHHRVDNNPFEGFKTVGAPSTVVVNGQVSYANGQFVGDRGTGRYLARKPVTRQPRHAERALATR